MSASKEHIFRLLCDPLFQPLGTERTRPITRPDSVRRLNKPHPAQSRPEVYFLTSTR